MGKDKLAVLCPGQGAHVPAMLDGHKGSKKFDEYYAIVSDTIGYSPLEVLKDDPTKINSNLLSSMLTVLASSISYYRFIDSRKQLPDYISGYSIGQLTSLFLAGCFDFEHLVFLIKTRAGIVGQCVTGTPHAMLAVIGVPQAPLEQFVSELQAQGQPLYISNFNCGGQYSLAGTRESIETAKTRISVLDPKMLVEIPVEFAWHCPLVEAAEQPIAEFLKGCHWRLPEIPVINCETGELFPDDVEAIKEQFLKQLANPVRWEKSIKTLINEGCSRLVEVGYGNTLTKFGFFIDRSVQHQPYYGEKVALCAE